MATDRVPLSVNMKSALSLLVVFLVAIVIALAITIASLPPSIALLASALVAPIIILGIVFFFFCRKRKEWSFGGASILGAIGVLLRVVISTQPGLEVGGGLPVGVTVLYIVLGVLLSLKSYESLLELRG
jgi:peptidoglycan/LPS O-acetylase OafA/YrhL